MPQPAQFLSGFELIPKTQFGKYYLSQATATHQTIKRYQEYEYQIVLIFNSPHKNLNPNDYKELFNLLMSKITQQPIIYGIRNPYECLIDTPSYGDITGSLQGPIIFNLRGHCYRNLHTR